MQPTELQEIVVRTFEHNSRDDQKARILRYEILNLSTGVDDACVDAVYGRREEEAGFIKIGAFLGDGLVGTLCLDPQKDGSLLLRQFAVSAKLQGMGIGKKLMDFTHCLARERGYTRITLDARQNVIGFYAKCGYRLTGKTFVHPQIVLEQMETDLSQTASEVCSPEK